MIGWRCAAAAVAAAVAVNYLSELIDYVLPPSIPNQFEYHVFW